MKSYTELPHDPRDRIPLQGIDLDLIRTYVHTKTWALMSTAVFFLRVPRRKSPKCPPTKDR